MAKSILTPNGQVSVNFVGQNGFGSSTFQFFTYPSLMFGKDMRLTNPVGHDTLALLSTISGDPPEYRVVYYVDDKEVCTRRFSVSPGGIRGFHSDGIWKSDGSAVSGVVGIFLKRGQTLTTNLPILYYHGKLYGCSTGLFLKIN